MSVSAHAPGPAPWYASRSATTSFRRGAPSATRAHRESSTAASTSCEPVVPRRIRRRPAGSRAASAFASSTLARGGRSPRTRQPAGSVRSCRSSAATSVGWSYPSVTFQSPAFASRYHRPEASRTRAPRPSTMHAPASARSNHSRIGAAPCHPAYVARVSSSAPNGMEAINGEWNE